MGEQTTRNGGTRRHGYGGQRNEKITTMKQQTVCGDNGCETGSRLFCRKEHGPVRSVCGNKRKNKQWNVVL